MTDPDTVHIEELSEAERELKRRLGRGVYVQDTDCYADGRVMHYLGNAFPKDTSSAAGKAEISFLNVGPIGAAIAHPADDEGYQLELPDRDAINDAFQARWEYETEHRAVQIPAFRNMLKDRSERQHELLLDYDWFESAGVRDFDHLGRAELLMSGSPTGSTIPLHERSGCSTAG